MLVISARKIIQSKQMMKNLNKIQITEAYSQMSIPLKEY